MLSNVVILDHAQPVKMVSKLVTTHSTTVYNYVNVMNESLNSPNKQFWQNLVLFTNSK